MTIEKSLDNGMTIRQEIRVRLIAEGRTDKEIDKLFEAHRLIDKMGLEIFKRRKAAKESRT